ncbi:hypothetical protein ECG_05804 [Echinococcus granulosus]|nr:hypothetical protein ECG_05804 [Echinococcus granulosus]
MHFNSGDKRTDWTKFVIEEETSSIPEAREEEVEEEEEEAISTESSIKFRALLKFSLSLPNILCNSWTDKWR